jgi:hypothetical protein
MSSEACRRHGLCLSLRAGGAFLACVYAPPRRRRRQQAGVQLLMPVRPAVAGHVEREFEPGPDAQPVKGKVFIRFIIGVFVCSFGSVLGSRPAENISKRFAKCSPGSKFM